MGRVKLVKKDERDKFVSEIVAEVKADFKKRQEERLSYERQWEVNLNFLRGNQYCGINGRNEVVTEEKGYFWQNRGVFNHIAPLIESRLAKLSRVNPRVYVRPKSDDDKDVVDADLAERVISYAFDKNDIKKVVKKATAWSETCGTSFYKIVWNNDGGKLVGEVDGKSVYEGEVQISALSPFEIFPDSITNEKIENCASIIHAKAVKAKTVEEIYGVAVKGEPINVYDLSTISVQTAGKSTPEKTISDSVVVIERYEAPTKEFPNGRLITVADDKLLYYGEMPYVAWDKGNRAYPFVKQECVEVPGSFFGTSVIERLIPVQRAYNAVKNRKHEFLNRLSNGVMTVEDGAVDLDDLESEGLPPGKVLVYRQGAKPPEMMSDALVPPDFSDEEEKLINEFVNISGVSDVSSSSKNANLSSGSALELLISQDNERLTVSAEIIRNCYLSIAKKSIHLYRQFTPEIKVITADTGEKKVKVYYAGKGALSSDTVYLESENELLYTENQKKEMIFKLYESGILSNDDGKLSPTTKEKVLDLLGYKDLDYRKGLSKLQVEKAQKENAVIRKQGLDVEIIDDHAIHIDEHVRYILSEYDELTEEEKSRLFSHVELHKSKITLKTED